MWSKGQGSCCTKNPQTLPGQNPRGGEFQRAGLAGLPIASVVSGFSRDGVLGVRHSTGLGESGGVQGLGRIEPGGLGGAGGGHLMALSA